MVNEEFRGTTHLKLMCVCWVVRSLCLCFCLCFCFCLGLVGLVGLFGIFKGCERGEGGMNCKQYDLFFFLLAIKALEILS